MRGRQDGKGTPACHSEEMYLGTCPVLRTAYAREVVDEARVDHIDGNEGLIPVDAQGAAIPAPATEAAPPH